MYQFPMNYFLPELNLIIFLDKVFLLSIISVLNCPGLTVLIPRSIPNLNLKDRLIRGGNTSV
jgi:hypothetical protein